MVPKQVRRAKGGVGPGPGRAQTHRLVAQVLVGLASDTTVYLSRWGGALEAFHHPRFRFLMALWAPRAPSVSSDPNP